MKKSIKGKLTVVFIIVMVCCIGSILLFNTLFLEKLYISEKKNIIKKSYYALENGITEAYDLGYSLSDLFKKKSASSEDSESNESNLARFLRELQENYNVSAVLMDADNNIYSLFQNNRRFDKRMMNYIFKGTEDDKSIDILEKTDNYTIAISNPRLNFPAPISGTVEGGPKEMMESDGPSSRNEENKNKKPNIFAPADIDADIECFGFLSDNETAFFITIPIKSIKEPIALFNKTLIMLSIFILVIGSIAIYIIASGFTKPLFELVNISKKLSRMEFEYKYKGNRQDEIGVLGNTINEMSDKLEKSIKEIKNANIQLKKDLEQRTELDNMRQEFVANVSHELKTPIALIEGYAEGLETPGIADSEENRNYYISVIKDEANKMNSMVHELLDLSALERGMDNIDIERINLNEIVSSVIKSFEIRFSEKGINVKIDIDEEIFVWADGYKLEQVIRNYISNAINHVDDKKIIKVFVDIISDEIVRFSVFNTGACISEDDMKKVWDKFYKVDKAHTRSYGGTGLGLSIVKAIANAHGTTCSCEAVTIDGNSGMKFSFDLNKK